MARSARITQTETSGPICRWLARAALALAAGVLAQSAAADTSLTVLPAPAGSGPVTLFYPSGAAAASVRRGPFVLQVALDAAPRRGNGHLVVMSHGSGGSPFELSDLAQTLVAAGFTVAVPEHAGDNWHDMSKVGPVSWKHRPQEVSQAIDAVAADPRFAPLLDFHHVGMYGMSAGGITALVLAGARWSPARFAQHCEAHLADDFPACVGLSTALTGGWLDKVRLVVARWVIHAKFADDTADQGWNDPRIAAVVAAVPMASPIDPASIASPRVPLGLVRAGQDAWLAPRWHIDAVLAACRPRCTLLADMGTAGHGSTLSPAVPGLTGRAAQLLNDPPGFDRAATLPVVYRDITGFFRKNLLAASQLPP